MQSLWKKKACTGTRWRAGIAPEQSSRAEALLLQGLSVKPQAVHRHASFTAAETHSQLLSPLLTVSPGQELARGHFPAELKHLCIPRLLSIRVHRNVKQSNPHLQRLNQHLRLTCNRSNFRMTCASYTPVVPGTPGAPA